MKQKTIQKFLIIFLSLLSLQGCIYMSMKQTTEFDEPSAKPIKFESKEASNLFFLKTKIVDIRKYKGPYLKEDSLMIPFIAFKNNRTFYETQYNNSKIVEADTNSDQIITLKEAENLKYERAALSNRSLTLIIKEN